MIAIYARASLDRDGTRAAVDRQVEECRALAERNGWTVDQVFIDNDRSATTGVRREGFEGMLAARPSKILCWHTDRLVRVAKDLERVIELGVPVHAVEAGVLDLTTPTGRVHARIGTTIATYEGEHKASRQRAANRQRAQRGIWLWTRRPFGFDREGHDVWIVPEEAEAIRQAAKKVLGGATLAQVAREWNAAGVTTTTGGHWSVSQVRRTLLSKRVAGRIVYQGTDYGPTGLSILDTETHESLLARLTDPRRRTAPSTRVRHLLSGLAVCGRCGGRMFASNNTPSNGGKYRVLICRGCRLTRHYDRVEQVVKATVIARLSRPDVADLLAVTEDVADLRAEMVLLRERRDALAALLAEGLLGPEAVRKQAQRLNTALEAAQRRLDAALGDHPLVGVADAPDPGLAFQKAPVARQRTVVSSLMEIVIQPVGRGGRFTPDQVSINWV